MPKCTTYIINELDSDIQQGGYLYKPTSETQWTPELSWMSDKPQKHISKSRPPVNVWQWCCDNKLVYLWNYQLAMKTIF